MHIEADLFADIVIIFVAAFLGGLAARMARFPLILGYLAVGMIIGPNALEVVGNTETVRTLAEFGVILLLFAVGIEVSFADLRRMGRMVVLGGLAQIAGTAGAGYAVGLLLGWSYEQSIVLGMVVSLSSTMVVLKTLTDRGDLRSVHGRAATGFLVLQDLAFIPMIAILPALGGDGGSALGDLGLGVLKAAAVLGGMALLGGRAIPWLLNHVAYLGSREIFIMAVVAITFATAALTDAVGLSAALGAFVAGLLLSESDYGQRALVEVVPLRDTFSSLFFVSLGMLTDPALLVDNFGTILVIVGIAVGTKVVLTTILVRGFGYLPYTALLTGLAMVQIGEFSFILADSATTRNVVDTDFLDLVVVSAVLTMAATPWVISGGAWAASRLERWAPALRPYRLAAAAGTDGNLLLRDHVVVCGLGRVGSLLAQALEHQQVPFAVIDIDPHAVARCHSRGHTAFNGASSSVAVLEAAGVRHARVMIISTSDAVSASATALHSLELNPKLDIVARVHTREEGIHLQGIGVREVVWPEMEVGLEMLRHSLQRFRTSRLEVDRMVDHLRSHLNFGTGPYAEEDPAEPAPPNEAAEEEPK